MKVVPAKREGTFVSCDITEATELFIIGDDDEILPNEPEMRVGHRFGIDTKLKECSWVCVGSPFLNVKNTKAEHILDIEDAKVQSLLTQYPLRQGDLKLVGLVL